jgi:ABC superfamily ATP binding cassette transporter, ABC protein
MVFQHANLMDALTTAQNVAYPLALARAPHGYRRERVSKMLELVGLTDRADSYPSQLSGGQKQRVGIARALADEPSVLLCDEPTSALDPETTRSILDLIRSARDSLGVTVVIITHEMSVVRSICDSVSLLEAGQIVEGGPIDEVVSQVDSRLSRELVPLPEVSEKVLGRGDVVVDLAITAKKGQPAAAKILTIAADRGGDVAGGVFQTIAGAQIGRLAITVEPSRAQGLIDALADAGAKPSLRDTSKEVAA